MRIESNLRMALAHNAKEKLRRSIAQKVGELDQANMMKMGFEKASVLASCSEAEAQVKRLVDALL